MCYAIPAKIVKINGSKGVIDYFGEQRTILLDDNKVRIGDYIYAQGGVLVRKVAEKEALEVLDVFKNIFFELKKVDESLSKIDQSKLPPNLLGILQKVNLQKTLPKNELLELFKLAKKEEKAVLYELANNIRQKQHGNACCVHGIIEFSNYCQNNCHYCGIRKDSALTRYRMNIEEILAAAKIAVEKYGFKALVLQSGEDAYYTDELLAKIVKEVKKLGVLVFLSIGSRSKETYKKLYEAGARAVLLRFETANAEIFKKLRPDTTLADRLDLIKYVRSLGYVLATGFILGLPGDETPEAILNNILLTKSLAPDMYSFGPLIPTQSTPLANNVQITLDLVLKTIAISRMADPDSNILVTTALETLNPKGKKDGMMAGGNSLMINLTPDKYRDLYHIYDHKVDNDISIPKNIDTTIKLLTSLGRAPTDVG
jgi:biotin synthase